MEQRAWLARRFAAMGYDLLIVLALGMATGAVALALTRGAMDAAHPPLAYRLALVVVVAGYFVLSWCRGGQTIGMRAWRLRLRGADGAPLSPLRAGVRFFLALLSLAPAGLGFWWALVDREGLTVHDRLCATRVERLPRR